MKNKKRIVVLLLCVIAFMAACNRETIPDGVIVLRGYAQMDLANPQALQWIETLEAFERAHPNIRIEWEYAAGELFHDRFQAMVAANDVPDIFTVYAGARSGYLFNRNLVKDIRPFLTPEFMAQFTSSIWEPQGPNGEIWIISPRLAVCTVIYVNTRLQRELGLENPETLDELIAQVPAIRQAGLTPLMFGNGGVWQAQSFLLSMLVDRMAGREWFDRAKAGTAHFTDPQFVAALDIVRRMVDTQLFPAGVNQIQGPEAWAAFVRGEAVYLLDAGWRIPALLNAATPEDFASYSVIGFPAISGEVTSNSSAATLGEAIGMNANLSGARAEAAWTFMSFIYGQVGSEILLRHGVVPTFNLNLDGIEIDHLTRQYIELVNSQSMGYVIDAVMDGEGVNNILNPGIQAVMMGHETSASLAARYEAWVAANDSNRRR